ncbi:MAG: hypothetical protein M1282_17325, partial [Chloroflexi bacterium]|nr:hypothetical protein [Chloroflexota bacterium]
KRKMVCIVAVTFVSAAPTGVIPTIKAMHAAMTKETEFGADDDTSARNPDQIGIINLGATIHKMLTGRNALAEVITDGLIVFCIGGLLCVIPRIPLSETEGLEVALFNVAGLLIFYHRTYDMALLITAGIALLPFLRRSRLSFETIILAISLVVLSYVCSSFRLMQIVGEWISWHQTIFLFFSFSRIIIVFCFIAGLFQLHRCTDVGKKS